MAHCSYLKEIIDKTCSFLFIERRVKLKHQFQAVSLNMLESTSFCADVEFFSGRKWRVRQGEMGTFGPLSLP